MYYYFLSQILQQILTVMFTENGRLSFIILLSFLSFFIYHCFIYYHYYYLHALFSSPFCPFFTVLSAMFLIPLSLILSFSLSHFQSLSFCFLSLPNNAFFVREWLEGSQKCWELKRALIWKQSIKRYLRELVKENK